MIALDFIMYTCLMCKVRLWRIEIESLISKPREENKLLKGSGGVGILKRVIKIDFIGKVTFMQKHKWDEGVTLHISCRRVF